MGGFCSKLSSSLFVTSCIERGFFENCNRISEKHARKFIRRKRAKKRPIISTPKPANPVFLNGVKWEHVIVTIPKIEEIPIPPPRKKRKIVERQIISQQVDSRTRIRAKTSGRELSSVRRTYSKLFRFINTAQLCKYLRVLKIGINMVSYYEKRESMNNEDGMYSKIDLLFSFKIVYRVDTTNITVPSSVSDALIGCSRNKSLINEITDSFFSNVGVKGYRFQNFQLFAMKVDLDELKFRQICRRSIKFHSAERTTTVKYFEIRRQNNMFEAKLIKRKIYSYARITKPLQNAKENNVYVLITLHHVNEANFSKFAQSKSILVERVREPVTRRLRNVKNDSLKTNQKWNNMYCFRRSDIEKVWKKMKKNVTSKSSKLYG